jgi:hypothetical protein
MREAEEMLGLLIEMGDAFNLANLASALGVSEPLTCEVSSGSPFLKYLSADWANIAVKPENVCYYSPQDNVVNVTSAKADCTDFIGQPQWGHQALVKPDDAGDARYTLPMKNVEDYMK